LLAVKVEDQLVVIAKLFTGNMADFDRDCATLQIGSFR
jgi:hypothetical protein